MGAPSISLPMPKRSSPSSCIQGLGRVLASWRTFRLVSQPSDFPGGLELGSNAVFMFQHMGQTVHRNNPLKSTKYFMNSSKIQTYSLSTPDFWKLYPRWRAHQKLFPWDCLAMEQKAKVTQLVDELYKEQRKISMILHPSSSDYFRFEFGSANPWGKQKFELISMILPLLGPSSSTMDTRIMRHGLDWHVVRVARQVAGASNQVYWFLVIGKNESDPNPFQT